MVRDGSRRPSVLPPPRPPPSAPGRPKRLADYNVVARIAGGGLSTIYVARRIGSDGTPVALKVIKHELTADDHVVDMFVDEARLLSRLVHPNIVRTLDVSLEGHEMFIAMELLLGMTLADVHEACAERGVRLASEIVAWIGSRIAYALGYAHEARDDAGHPLGVIHRDVNLRNVLVTFDGEVKLFDFGLAKAAGHRAARTQPGIVKGTLPYVSPEQIMQLELDGRSDVFGLGTSIWELLTSRRLFRRETDEETLLAIHSGPIPDPRSVAPEVPFILSGIVMRALERNRDNRYATATELGQDLEAYARARGLDDGPERLRRLVTTLFPDDERRQRGWLRPLGRST